MGPRRSESTDTSALPLPRTTYTVEPRRSMPSPPVMPGPPLTGTSVTRPVRASAAQSPPAVLWSSSAVRWSRARMPLAARLVPS